MKLFNGLFWCCVGATVLPVQAQSIEAAHLAAITTQTTFTAQTQPLTEAVFKRSFTDYQSAMATVAKLTAQGAKVHSIRQDFVTGQPAMTRCTVDGTVAGLSIQVTADTCEAPLQEFASTANTLLASS
jgi:hypothetical protein